MVTREMVAFESARRGRDAAFCARSTATSCADGRRSSPGEFHRDPRRARTRAVAARVEWRAGVERAFVRYVRTIERKFNGGTTARALAAIAADRGRRSWAPPSCSGSGRRALGARSRHQRAGPLRADGIPPLQPRGVGHRRRVQGGRSRGGPALAGRWRGVSSELAPATSRGSRSSGGWSRPTGRSSRCCSGSWCCRGPPARCSYRAVARLAQEWSEAPGGEDLTPLDRERERVRPAGSPAARAARLDTGAADGDRVRRGRRLRGRGRELAHAGGRLVGARGRQGDGDRARERCRGARRRPRRTAAVARGSPRLAPELGTGDPVEPEVLPSAVGLVWRALVLWLS